MTVTLPNCAAKYQSFNGNLPQDTADLELAAAEQRDLQRQLQQIAGGWLQILSAYLSAGDGSKKVMMWAKKWCARNPTYRLEIIKK